jgi:tRNA-modifying protein YgfZ
MSGTSSLTIDPEVERGYDLLREDCGVLNTERFVAFELMGDDRKGWLQGQATNDLRNMAEGTSVAFCLCSPTGQLLADCHMWLLPERLVVTTDIATAPAFAQRCESMVILEDVTCRDLSGTQRLFSVQGPSATSRLSRGITLPTLDAGVATLDGHQIMLLRSNRTGYGGWDLLVPPEAEGLVAKLLGDISQVRDEAAEIARIEAGIPRVGADLSAKTLPPELGRAFQTSHISYTKGCYTGQEVLMRLHSRGHTNRTWMGLLADAPLEEGAIISHPSRADAGVVTSAALSPRYGFIGAAMLRNEAAMRGEMVTVQTSNGAVEAEVVEMPILTNA